MACSGDPGDDHLMKDNGGYYSQAIEQSIKAGRPINVTHLEKELGRIKKFARAGFVCTGRTEYDEVQCLQCGVTLYSWPQGKDPLAVHKQCSPTCPFIVSLALSPSGQQRVPEVAQTGQKHTGTTKHNISPFYKKGV